MSDAPFESIMLSFQRMAEAATDAGRVIRSVGYRMRGWRDMADVVQHQEGREIVRSGMHDIRVWLGEVDPDEQIKIRLWPYDFAAYVSEWPDEDGLHHGTMKHSDSPVSARWDKEGQRWLEVEMGNGYPNEREEQDHG